MSRIQIALAPYSATGLETSVQEVPITWEEYLNQVVTAGFAGTELGPPGFMTEDAEQLRWALRDRNLLLAGGPLVAPLVDREAVEPTLARAMDLGDFLSTVGGGPVLVLSDEPKPDRVPPTANPQTDHPEGDWKFFATNIENIARQVLGETGTRTVYLPKRGAFAESVEEVDRLLDQTDPDFVGLCLDTGLVSFLGDNPLNLLYQYGDRVRHVHFRDLRADVAEQARTHDWPYPNLVRGGLYPLLGEGSVRFRAILGELEGLEYNGWVVVPESRPEDADHLVTRATRARKFLKELGV